MQQQVIKLRIIVMCNFILPWSSLNIFFKSQLHYLLDLLLWVKAWLGGSKVAFESAYSNINDFFAIYS